MTEANCNIALHVCGQSAAQNLASIINGNICTKSSVIDILTRELPIHLFQRIQINGNKKSLKYNLFSDKLKYNFPFNQTKFIFQTNHEGITEEEKECLFDTNVNIQFLVDESGGKGKELSLPDTYSDTNKEALMLFRNSGRFGYAGGIGYDNVNKVVNELENIVNAEYWIDMESNIRNESDQFDVSKCANVLEEVVLALNNK